MLSSDLEADLADRLRQAYPLPRVRQEFADRLLQRAGNEYRLSFRRRMVRSALPSVAAAIVLLTIVAIPLVRSGSASHTGYADSSMLSDATQTVQQTRGGTETSRSTTTETTQHSTMPEGPISQRICAANPTEFPLLSALGMASSLTSDGLVFTNRQGHEPVWLQMNSATLLIVDSDGVVIGAFGYPDIQFPEQRVDPGKSVAKPTISVQACSGARRIVNGSYQAYIVVLASTEDEAHGYLLHRSDAIELTISGGRVSRF